MCYLWCILAVFIKKKHKMRKKIAYDGVFLIFFLNFVLKKFARKERKDRNNLLHL